MQPVKLIFVSCLRGSLSKKNPDFTTQQPRRVPNISTGLRKDCPTGLHGLPKQVPNGYFEKFSPFNQYLGVVGPTPSLRHDFMADINRGDFPIDPKSG